MSSAESQSQWFFEHIFREIFLNQIKNSNFFEILLEETQSPGPYLEIDTKKPAIDAILGLWTVLQIYLIASSFYIVNFFLLFEICKFWFSFWNYF